MGKKRKAPSTGGNVRPKASLELDPADARLGPISTYQDVANSEDEYFLQRDKIMLDDDHTSKRIKKDDADFELSDEEILAADDSPSDSDNYDDNIIHRGGPKPGNLSPDNNADDAHQDEEPDSGWWGSHKTEYYDADKIETEADALEEEAEAKRLQKKRLDKMIDQDFVLDGGEWLAGAAAEEEQGETVTEVLRDVEVNDTMGPAERNSLLASSYPEFGFLVDEFQQLHPLLASLKAGALGSSGTMLDKVKYWILGCYVAALASYFAIFTSPARDSPPQRKSLPPSELREHEVMETLVRCRNAWNKARTIKPLSRPGQKHAQLDGGAITTASLAKNPPDNLSDKANKDPKTTASLTSKLSKRNKLNKSLGAKSPSKLNKAVENSIAELYNLPISGVKSAGQPKSQPETQPMAEPDDGSDFGEEEILDARAAVDKAARKKSLKFYTSQIVQKANRRAGAGRDAGGDTDIPYRERLRDRQARLVAQAEKRGKRGSKHGADLDDGSDDDKDAATAKEVRNDEDDYYNLVAQSAKARRDDKAARYAAYATAGKADRVVEHQDVGDDGKRKITYAIEKNKGLAPKRSKDVRNPRVRRRKQYDAKQKKLRSMKPTWKGGEPKGGYQGELSGINTAVIKSVKL